MKILYLEKRALAGFTVLLLIGGCAGLFPRSEFRRKLKGKIGENRRLSGNILVAGDILVPKGVTLTLDPGTVLKFAENKKTLIDPKFLFNTHELLVRGSLIARGTSEKPIRFIGEQEVAKLWAGIILDHSQGSTLANCFIGQAEYGLYAIASNVKMERVTIDQVQYGLVLQKGSKPEISGLKISRAEVGVSCPKKLASQITAHYKDVTVSLSAY